MKLLVLSDSHSRVDRMALAAKITKPDAVLHLGDYTHDLWELRRQAPGVEYFAVAGNGDFDRDVQDELILSFPGVTILMTHGHRHGVKSGLGRLAAHALAKNAGLVLFGHTHQALSLKVEDTWLFNPGQMYRHDRQLAATYGVVTVGGGGFSCEIRGLPG